MIQDRATPWVIAAHVFAGLVMLYLFNHISSCRVHNYYPLCTMTCLRSLKSCDVECIDKTTQDDKIYHHLDLNIENGVRACSKNVDPSPFVYSRRPRLTLRKAAIPLTVTPTLCQLCLLRFNVVRSVFSYVMSARFNFFSLSFSPPFFYRMRLSLQSGPPTTHTLGSFPGRPPLAARLSRKTLSAPPPKARSTLASSNRSQAARKRSKMPAAAITSFTARVQRLATVGWKVGLGLTTVGRKDLRLTATTSLSWQTQRCTRSSSLDGITPSRPCANAKLVRIATPTHIASFSLFNTPPTHLFHLLV